MGVAQICKTAEAMGLNPAHLGSLLSLLGAVP